MFEADILCLEALDRLSRGDFEAAGKILDHGMHVCATGSFGSARLDIARLSLGLSVAGNAFNQNEFEAAFRVILMCSRDEETVRPSSSATDRPADPLAWLYPEIAPGKTRNASPGVCAKFEVGKERRATTA